jgi:hypothetical protein
MIILAISRAKVLLLFENYRTPIAGYIDVLQKKMCAWFDEKSYFEFFPLHAVYKKY